MTSFADIQYYIYTDIVGGSEKVQNYADVIYGWSLGDPSSDGHDYLIDNE